MSNELMRYTAKSLARDNEPFSRTAGRSLAVAGTSGLALWAVAGVIPFLSLPFLLVALVVAGGWLYVK